VKKHPNQPASNMMRTQDWHDAGVGWQGKEGELRLQGWSWQRRS